MGLVRLFLAMVVAADHWWLSMLHPKAIVVHDQYRLGFNSGYAVMFFYVISGFLITYTLTRNYKLHATGVTAFYRNRFIRIYSLYWPMVVLTFLFVGGAWAQFLAADAWDKLTGIFLVGMDWRLSFASYPQVHFAAGIVGLKQAWTLGAELMFYLLAPLLMRFWPVAVSLLIASFGLRAYFVLAYGTDIQDIWTYHFIGTTFGFFMLGHLVCRFGRLLAEPLIGWALVVCSFAVMFWSSSYGSYDTLRFWGSVLFFTLALPGLFEATKNIGWMNHLGNLSYPLYLVHTGVLILVGPWLLQQVLTQDEVGAYHGYYLSIGLFVAVSTVAALGVHKLLEEPIAQALRVFFQKRKIAARA
jgi:peptidoglycan/LPS O-acetylase OafA/YrhL